MLPFILYMGLFTNYVVLEGTACYEGLLLAPAEGCGRGQGFIGPSGKILCFFLLILGFFWCLVVTSVTLINNLSNFFKKAQKNPTEITKKLK